MKNSELLLKHYQYRSDAHAYKGNIIHVPWSETSNDFVDSITNEDFIKIFKKLLIYGFELNLGLKKEYRKI